jgi:translation initiation factor 2 subunit 2
LAQRRASRKSVAFTDEKLVVAADGSVTKIASPIDDTKDTAMSHTPRTPPLHAALEAFTDASQATLDEPAIDGAADDGELDLSLMKKKKKKVAKKEDDADAGDDEAAAGGEEVIDLSMKKKKKKKAPKDADEFAKKLEALNLEGNEGEGGGSEPTGADGEQGGDMDKGTGIWAHDETTTINYDQALERFFAVLAQKNPDHASSGTKSYKIPPPQCLREGA